MSAVRQNWITSLKSPRSSALVSGNSIWYDAPAPVIVHGRHFDGDELETEHELDDPQQREIKRSELHDDCINEADLVESPQRELPLYQNNSEASLNSLNGPRKDDRPNEKSDQPRQSLASAAKKRQRSSIELRARTSVRTDAEGVPRITFSFLRSEEKPERDSLADGCDSLEQLYDFPRSSPAAEASALARLESAGNSSQLLLLLPPTTTTTTPVARGASQASVQSASPALRARRLRAANLACSESDSGLAKSFSFRAGSQLKWRRSLAKLEDLLRATRSGSHSDSEDVVEPAEASGAGCSGSTSSGSGTSRRRLGKAWHKMRHWLSEERSKLGEVVARHARLQAVGAHLEDGAEESGSAVGISLGLSSGSYDLSRAQLGLEQGALPRVEEFGPDAAPSGSERRPFRKRAIKKSTSSDDILAEKQQPAERPAATSFSLERLCADEEAEDEEDEEGAEGADKLAEIGQRNRASQRPRAKLIKMRMLGSIRGLIASTHLLHEAEESGTSGFEEVRRYVKQGGDFCKELAAIIHERAELEANYAKGLSKLSGKLTKACAKDQGGNCSAGVSEAWRCVGEEMEAAAEAHRVWGSALSEQLAKPLRVGVAEVQGRTRKSIENSVDKASKSLQEWRTAAAKTKKQSFACARENERLQDLVRLQTISQTHQQQQQQQQHVNNKLVSSGLQQQHYHHHHHQQQHGQVSEKEASKLEARRRKAEDSARRADTEFYTVTVRAERARLEYECSVRKAAKQMELLEEERLSALKDLANVYLAHLQALAPKLQQSADRVSQPIRNCSVSQDVEILRNLIRRIDSNDSASTEQLLPDFYAEHVTLAMNRERRKQALVRVLHLIRQDLERERRGREGLETLHRAFIRTPAFAADESTQNVTDKLLHMRSMLTYLEAARYKVGGALSEIEGGKRDKHPLAEHILVSRDKQGLQQSVLKVPSWAKNESFEFQDGASESELEVLHLSGKECNESEQQQQRDWADRTAGDGNSENPPDEEDFSDFDEFSSNSEDNNNQEVEEATGCKQPGPGPERCRAIYHYSANLNDELSLSPGDLITVHEKQADGWWIGECRGRTGIFPATYVQLIN